MESIVNPTDDKSIYTRRAIVIRSALIFIGYAFIFLAAANELIDVLLTFFGIVISPRQALLTISLMQITVWLFGGFYPLYKDKSFIYAGYIFFMLLVILLSAETELGATIFGDFASGFRVLGTLFIILSVIGAGVYTSLTYYSRNYHQK